MFFLSSASALRLTNFFFSSESRIYVILPEENLSRLHRSLIASDGWKTNSFKTLTSVGERLKLAMGKGII